MVKRLFKIQNFNASTIRTVMVAHCRRHDTPDLLLDYEAQSQAQQQYKGDSQHHQPLLFNLGASDSEEDDEDERDIEDEEHAEARHSVHRTPHLGSSTMEHVRQVVSAVYLCSVTSHNH